MPNKNSSSANNTTSVSTSKLDKILQQIQRQFIVHNDNNNSSSTSSKNNNEMVTGQRRQQQRRQQQLLLQSRSLPNAAACVLGRELAKEFIQIVVSSIVLSTASSSLSTAIDAKLATTTETVTNGGNDGDGSSSSSTAAAAAAAAATLLLLPVRERVFVVLIHSGIHPSISHSFLENISEWLYDQSSNNNNNNNNNNTTTTSSNPSMASSSTASIVTSSSIYYSFSWLAQWVLRMEEIICKEQQQYHSSSKSSSFTTITTNLGETLCAMIRTYAVYLTYYYSHHGYQQHEQQQQQQQQQHQHNNNGQDDTKTTTTTRPSNSTTKMTTFRTTIATTTTMSTDPFLTTYMSLQVSSSRIMLIRELIPLLWDYDPNQAMLVQAPIIAYSILSLSSSSSTSSSTMSERRMILQYWYRAMGLHWIGTSNPTIIITTTTTTTFTYTIQQCYTILQYAMDALNWFLVAIVGAQNSNKTNDVEQQFECIDIAEYWVMETVLLAKYLMSQPIGVDNDSTTTNTTTTTTATTAATSQWIHQLIGEILPKLLILSNPNIRFVWRPLLDTILDCLEGPQAIHILTTTIKPSGIFDTDTILQLASITIATPLQQDRQVLLILLSLLRPHSTYGIAILHSVASMFLHEEPYQEAAMLLHQSLRPDGVGGAGPMYQYPIKHNYKRKVSDTMKFPNLLEESFYNDGALVDHFLSILDFTDISWSALQQISALLLGLALLDDKKKTDVAHSYVGRLLQKYPYLTMLVLPVFLERLHDKSTRGNGVALVQCLTFTCQYLVGDLYCAQQVWNLMGIQWMQTHTHLSVRVLLLRLFPKLCTGNKRLYGRVVQVLVLSSKDKTPEIRLAVAVTIAELAQEDSLLDVSEVIGAIQNLLVEDRTTPVHSLIVRYAVLCLHFLTVNQELEFDLVIKVLKKKLCSVTDKASVLSLPVVVLEALALLLGDGQITGDGRDGELDGLLEPNRASLVTISAQVSGSVQALIDIGIDLNSRPQSDFEPGSKVALHNTQMNVLLSLNRYSFEALGLDAIGVKAIFDTADDDGEGRPAFPVSAIRYNTLRHLMSGILETLVDDSLSSDAVSKFLGKMLAFEQEVLGGSLWIKRGAITPKSQDSKQVKKSQNILSALPSRTLIKEYSDRSPSPSTAASIATLLSSDGKQISVLRDHADSSIDSADPLMIVFALHGFVRTAERILETHSANINDVVSEVRGWHEIFLSSDAWYLTLSALSIYIPLEPDSTSPTSSVAEIVQQVISAFSDHVFQKERISKVCLGLVGISSLRCANLDLLQQIICILEESVRGYGGYQDFGAYFGLALIACETAQSIGEQNSGIPSTVKIGLISRISSFLIEELLSCYTEGGEELQQLVMSIKRGSASKGLVQSIESLGSNSMALLMTKYVIARDLFISCAVCLPSLVAVQGDLLLAVLRLLESFEWGGGKGIAIPSVLDACRRASLISHGEFVQIHAEYSSIFERRMVGDDADIDSDGLEDIFYAVNAMSKQAATGVVSRLLVGNKELFDDDGRAISLIAATSSVACLPLFGLARFIDPTKLYGTSAKKDIRGIVEIINEAATLNDNTMYCNTATMLTGLLSSIKEVISSNSTERADSQHVEEPTEIQSATYDGPDGIVFDQLPTPLPGTFLESTMNVMKQYYCQKSEGGDIYHRLFTRALSSLGNLSVPGRYAKGFIEKLLVSKNVPKISVIDFLITQVVGRRSALFDGRDYVNLAVQISTTRRDEFGAFWDDKQSAVSFVRRLPDMVPKFPTESLHTVISSIWSNCRLSRSEGREAMLAFLSSFKVVLQSTAFSPKGLSVVRNFAISELFNDLQDVDVVQLHTGTPSMLDLYASCLKEVPMSLLDQTNFFTLNGTHEGFNCDIFRILLLLSMINTGVFESSGRTDQYLRKLFAWMLKSLSRLTSEKEVRSLRRVLVLFATAARQMPTDDRRDKVMSLFEVLLMSTNESMKTGLELLAVMLATWSSGQFAHSSISWSSAGILHNKSVEPLSGRDLERLYQIALADLACNMNGFAADYGVATLMANQLQRLNNHCSERGVEQRIQSIVRHALILCQSKADNVDVFVSLSSSIMQWGLSIEVSR